MTFGRRQRRDADLQGAKGDPEEELEREHDSDAPLEQRPASSHFH
jgi:deferrochelatase/peroxidase EfeB